MSTLPSKWSWPLLLRGLLLLSIYFSDGWMIGEGVMADPKPATPELVIYAQDNFLAPGGLGQEILPRFEKQCRCRVRALSCGDGGQILTRLQLDAKRGKQVAHVVVGLDQYTWTLAKPGLQSWQHWEPSGYSKISKDLKIENGFLPYEYGVLAWMADRQALKNQGMKLPRSLKDLLRSEWKRNLILEDPRTSTPGLGFLLFTEQVLGTSMWEFWSAFRSQWLTLTPGWNQAYGLFLKQEAPLVWSYLTSQAYHEEQGDGASGQSRRYQAVLFEEGQPLQIEGAALVEELASGGGLSPEVVMLAHQFLSFLISDEVQELVPKKAWMLPVSTQVKVPDSFKHLDHPTRLVQSDRDGKRIQATLTRWSQVIEK